MRVKTQAKRDAIVDAAAQAFCELGFERTSMAEIAARVGGSKATLYGYFASKDELFVAVARHFATQQLDRAFATLEEAGDDTAATLRQFGELMVRFVCSPGALQSARMVLAEAGTSVVGRLFYESGPFEGLKAVEAYLTREQQVQRLKPCDPLVAAKHLVALLHAELHPPMMYGVVTKITQKQIEQSVQRAVAAFMAAYGVPAGATARTPASTMPAPSAAPRARPRRAAPASTAA